MKKIMSFISVCALLLMPVIAQAEACIIRASGGAQEIQICQKNLSIPASLFKSGFCKPRLAGQKTTVTFAEQCPTGAFGVCRNAQTGGPFYKQDIHYYGVASDARFLQPACEQQNKGVWMQPGQLLPDTPKPSLPEFRAPAGVRQK